MNRNLPDMTHPDFASIFKNNAGTDDNIRPLGMFRCNGRYLLCYDTFAFLVDNHGGLVKNSWIEWEGNPQSIAFCYPYVVAFDPRFIEVRHAETVSSGITYTWTTFIHPLHVGPINTDSCRRTYAMSTIYYPIRNVGTCHSWLHGTSFQTWLSIRLSTCSHFSTYTLIHIKLHVYKHSHSNPFTPILISRTTYPLSIYNMAFACIILKNESFVYEMMNE